MNALETFSKRTMNTANIIYTSAHAGTCTCSSLKAFTINKQKDWPLKASHITHANDFSI